MKRVIACAVVLVTALAVPPATAQTGRSGWTPTDAQPTESAGEVVFRFTAVEAGRIVVYTSDGDCNRNPGVEYPYTPTAVTPDCGRPQARAGEDYVAVRGEWIFSEPGTRTIRVPILDDDEDEPGSEPFGVYASEYDDVAEQTAWYVAVVRILDDDPKVEFEPGPTSTTLTTSDVGAPPAPWVAAASPPATRLTPVAAVPSSAASPPGSTTTSLGRRFEVAVQMRPQEELEPGPGFELMVDPGPGAGIGRPGRSGLTPSVRIGLAGSALMLAAAWARRRWRWSTAP